MFALGAAAPPGDMTKLKDDEKRARNVFGPHIGGHLIAYSPDPPDFVLVRGGVVVGWAEATNAVDGKMRAFAKEMSKLGYSFPTERLVYDWMVSFTKDAMLKKLDQEQLVDILLRHEAILAPDWLGEPDRRVQIRLSLEDIRDQGEIGAAFDLYGVEYVYPMRLAEGEATVSLLQPGMESSVGPDLITELAEEKAQVKADRLKDLNGEGHLLIGVDTYWPTGAAFALSDAELPNRAPELPEAITDVWLATVTTRVWHFSANTGWEFISTEAATAR